MRVLSWRVRSAAIGSSPDSSGNFFAFGTIIRPTLIFVTAILLSACTPPSRKPDLVFDAGALNDQQFEQAGKECRFEAAKAVAPRKYGDITGDTYRKIFILCLEAKGIKFLGTEDQLKRPI
jgi:hypothetical protein